MMKQGVRDRTGTEPFEKEPKYARLLGVKRRGRASIKSRFVATKEHWIFSYV